MEQEGDSGEDETAASLWYVANHLRSWNWSRSTCTPGQSAGNPSIGWSQALTPSRSTVSDSPSSGSIQFLYRPLPSHICLLVSRQAVDVPKAGEELIFPHFVNQSSAIRRTQGCPSCFTMSVFNLSFHHCQIATLSLRDDTTDLPGQKWNIAVLVDQICFYQTSSRKRPCTRRALHIEQGCPTCAPGDGHQF